MLHERQEMNQELVERLESEIENAVEEILIGMKDQRLPITPSQQTIHLMAKAAVTVYETAVANQQPER